MSNNELSVSIPGFRNVSFEDEIFTVYKIHVINENKEYEIEKRFSAFKELHEALEDGYGRSMVPSFPKTKFFENKFLPAVIERRRSDLEIYLQAVVSKHSLRYSPEVINYLKPLRVATEIQRPSRDEATGTVFGITEPHSVREVLAGAFHLPPIPPGLNIPERFIFPNGQPFHLNPMLQEACNALHYLSTQHAYITTISGENAELDRIAAIGAISDSLNLVTASLEQQKANLEAVLSVSSGKISVDAIIHLTSCLSAMEQGLIFARELAIQAEFHRSMQACAESEFNSSNVSSDDNNENIPNVESDNSHSISLEKDSDKDIGGINLEKTELSVDDAEKHIGGIDLEKKDESINDLDKHIGGINLEKDNEIPNIEEPVDNEIPQLPDDINIDNLLIELQSQFETLRDNLDNLIIKATTITSKIEASEICVELDSLRETILTVLQNYNIGAIDETEQYRNIRLLCNEVDQSKKDIQERTFVEHKQSPIEKMETKIFEMIQRIEDIPHDNASQAKRLKEDMKEAGKLLVSMRKHEGFTKSEKNRLEDLQENLSDLKHNFNKKFKVAEKPKDKAMQKALELRVKRAQKQHQALEDDMFAL
mmetsp:Transcript_34254/g.58634  ORF Transcript_34254/g.58634 Transcript_34254/m.58634 type:complete len:596 (+) Transcript_34254:30-1817(+)